MLIARVKVTADEERRDELVDTLAAEAETMPEAFDGCELFVVSVAADDPNTVLIAEEWETKDHFDAYVGSAHFASVMSKVAPCLAGPPDSAYYEGERVGP